MAGPRIGREKNKTEPGISCGSWKWELPYDSPIPLDIQKNWKQDLRYLHTHIHHSTIHNSQAVGATQMSTNKWMDG